MPTPTLTVEMPLQGWQEETIRLIQEEFTAQVMFLEWAFDHLPENLAQQALDHMEAITAKSDAIHAILLREHNRAGEIVRLFDRLCTHKIPEHTPFFDENFDALPPERTAEVREILPA